MLQDRGVLKIVPLCTYFNLPTIFFIFLLQDCHSQQYKTQMCGMEQRTRLHSMWRRRRTPKSSQIGVWKRQQRCQRISGSVESFNEPNFGRTQWSDSGRGVEREPPEANFQRSIWLDNCVDVIQRYYYLGRVLIFSLHHNSQYVLCYVRTHSCPKI